jgi:peptide-methionine (S)-S-oxide reductase
VANSLETDVETQVAVLGGGCFWCLDAVFRELEGVVAVTSGYCGGSAADADYEAVCSGRTEHAEVLEIRFDPQRISFAEVLEVFFTMHDPTTLDRQGNDVGRQYRSVIFCRTPEQRQLARDFLERLAGDAQLARPPVTELAGDEVFYPAEEYHQNYFAHHPEQAYCAYVVAPKVAKFRQHFATRCRMA